MARDVTRSGRSGAETSTNGVFGLVFATVWLWMRTLGQREQPGVVMSTTPEPATMSSGLTLR